MGDAPVGDVKVMTGLGLDVVTDTSVGVGEGAAMDGARDAGSGVGDGGVDPQAIASNALATTVTPTALPRLPRSTIAPIDGSRVRLVIWAAVAVMPHCDDVCVYQPRQRTIPTAPETGPSKRPRFEDTSYLQYAG